MNCDCFDKIDDQLREINLRLSGYAFIMPKFEMVPTVTTEWVDKSKAPKGQKNSPTQMHASHCPFCGKPVRKPSRTKASKKAKEAK